MPDAVTSLPAEPDADQLDALCRELAEAADAVGEAARYASELALGSRLPVSALRWGGRGGRGRRAGGGRLAWRTLLRTLTDPAGLGWALRGRGVARAGRLAGVLAGRESLAVSMAVCGLRTRIRAARAGFPGPPADPDAAAILTAVEQGRQGDAVRLFRAAMRERGAGHAFGILTPSFADILAWNALTDGNPFNDHAGWQVATGRAMTAEPLLGLGAACRAFFDRGPTPGRARAAGDRAPGRDRATGDRGPGRDRAAGDRNGRDRAAGERDPGCDRAAGDREPGIDRAAGDRNPGRDRAAGDRAPGWDRAAGDREPGREDFPP
ncbi:hypothetical protein [Streptomyces goshikiensis]|uniref:hypothetical protein n=1 Tax=Streptomyces goshikiensis TaxID=1942 RepID=UPI0036C376CD